MVTAEEGSLLHASKLPAVLAAVIAVGVVPVAVRQINTLLCNTTIGFSGVPVNEAGGVAHQWKMVLCVVTVVANPLSILLLIIKSNLNVFSPSHVREEVCLSVVSWGTEVSILVAAFLAGILLRGTVIMVFGTELPLVVLHLGVSGLATVRDGDERDGHSFEVESRVDALLAYFHV